MNRRMKNDPTRIQAAAHKFLRTTFLLATKAASAESFNALFKKSFELIKFCDDGERRKRFEHGSRNNNHLAIFHRVNRQKAFCTRSLSLAKRNFSVPIFIDFICHTQYVRLTDIGYQRAAREKPLKKGYQICILPAYNFIHHASTKKKKLRIITSCLWS